MRRLKEIPASLRTPEIESLLADEEVRLSEISTLSAELRGMDGRFSLEQLDKLGRLLELYPNHPQGMEMAWRICRRVFESAQAAFAECRYAKASKLLERLPPAVRTPEIEALRKRAMEIQYLVQVLRTSAWVDKQLVALAGRLRKLSPTDKAIRSYCDEIFRRARVAPPPPRFAIPWIAPPAKGATPCPLESPAGFQRICLCCGVQPGRALGKPRPLLRRLRPGPARDRPGGGGDQSGAAGTRSPSTCRAVGPTSEGRKDRLGARFRP